MQHLEKNPEWQVSQKIMALLIATGKVTQEQANEMGATGMLTLGWRTANLSVLTSRYDRSVYSRRPSWYLLPCFYANER